MQIQAQTPMHAPHVHVTATLAGAPGTLAYDATYRTQLEALAEARRLAWEACPAGGRIAPSPGALVLADAGLVGYAIVDAQACPVSSIATSGPCWGAHALEAPAAHRCPACGADTRGGNGSPLYDDEGLCADCGEARFEREQTELALAAVQR